MKIIFASPAFHYQSYHDLHTVFSECDIPHIKIPHITDEENTVYVYSPANGELEGIKHKKGRKCKLIWWFLERIPPGQFEGFKKEYEKGYWDGIMISDMGYHDALKSLNVNVTFCPVGYHPLFGTPNFNYQKIYDFAHMSYRDIWRRSQLFGKLSKYRIAPNAWGDQRTTYLYQSKFMLNTHQDESKAAEPLRLLMAVAHGLPIISELIPRPRPYNHPVVLHMASYRNLVSKVKEVISAYNRRPNFYIEQAKQNFDIISKINFIEEVKAAVSRLV